MSHPTITQNGALLHAHRQSGRRGDAREMRRQIGAGKRGRRALRWQGFKNAVRRAWINFKPASFRESDFPIS
jgi:hypothetical protein